MSQDGRSQGGGGAGGCGGSGGSTSPQGSPITLSVPRPDHQRTSNLYVDTPFKHRVAPRPRPQHHHHHHHHLHTSLSSSSSSPATGRTHVDLALVHGAPARTSGKRPTKLTSPTGGGVTGAPVKGGNNSSSTITTTPVTTNNPSLSSSSSSSSATLQQSGSRTPIISKQPAALTFTKGRRDDTSDGESIICSWCGRCRCEACTKPRPPPSAWLCHNKCLCSPAAAVDYASCLCCVKGILYHCCKDSENDLVAAADHPCSCRGPHVLLSWACLAVASIPLPCLLCYWPLTGARRVVETTYQRCTSHGCRCPQGRNLRLQPPPPHPPPEKRPLHDCA